jgi:hypothetical protein
MKASELNCSMRNRINLRYCNIFPKKKAKDNIAIIDIKTDEY